jgi:hypothetical protein
MSQRADDIIDAERHITSQQLAEQLSVSSGRAMVVTDTLGYLKVQDVFLEVSRPNTGVGGESFV